MLDNEVMQIVENILGMCSEKFRKKLFKKLRKNLRNRPIYD